VATLLSELIRLDTVNPPGNETRAAEHLRVYLEANGVACDLFAKVPERRNLVARIPGSGDGPRLAFLSHTTRCSPIRPNGRSTRGRVSSATARSGARRARHEGPGGRDRGRDGVLAREGFQPKGDVIFIAAADEEVGVDFGLAWLCREHPDAVAPSTR
jgi:acetylornithine deacetylase/succinyl-diaminopimelate desuccinylase-like protein